MRRSLILNASLVLALGGPPSRSPCLRLFSRRIWVTALLMGQLCCGRGDTTSELSDRAEWTLATQPLFVVSDQSGSPVYRVVAAFLDGRGRVIIGSAGNHEIIWVDTTDSSAGRFGREGEGPGEFRALSDLFSWPGDSLLAWDAELRRVTLFSPGGDVAWSRNLPSLPQQETERLLSAAPSTAFGSFGDGTVLLRTQPAIAAASQGEVVATATVFRWRPSTGDLFRLGVIPWTERVVQGTTERGAHFRATVETVPVAKGKYVVGLGRTGALSIYDTSGALISKPEIERTAQEVTPEVLGAYRAWILRRLQGAPPDMIRDTREHFDAFPVAELVPIFDRVIVDDRERVWVRLKGNQVRHYDLDGRDAKTWVILTESGQELGQMVAPGPFNLTAVQGEIAVGVWTDDDGVETVRMYAVH